MGYTSENALISFLVENNNYKIAFHQKFAELKSFENSKSALEKAILKVLKSSTKPLHTDLDCLAAYAASLAACTEGCYLYASNISNCIADCWIAVSLLDLICILTAD